MKVRGWEERERLSGREREERAQCTSGDGDTEGRRGVKGLGNKFRVLVNRKEA